MTPNTTERPIGIDDLSFSTTHYRLDQDVLASRLGVDAAKLHTGLGQDAFSVPATDEDIVTMAATAAQPIIARHGPERIRTILFATETGVDQSKAAGLYVHGLLGLPATCRVVELKQACYSATAALQFATALIARDPGQQVLVLASDIAKYQLGSEGEPTQGAAAAAMLVTADPAVLRIDPCSGVYSEDISDFWRPNYRTEAVVDGKLSIDAYKRATREAFADYQRRGGRYLDQFAAFCYHQPFTKMAYKAHRHLLEHAGTPGPDGDSRTTTDASDSATDAADLDAALAATTHYNRAIGNSYTASAYLALASLLDHRKDLADQPIAVISYGSGAVAEFFGGTVVPGYRDHLRTTANAHAIARRQPIDYQHYQRLHHESDLTDDADRKIEQQTTAPYRLAAIADHQRIYEATI
ncbi:hydroxymethylglutaryl-CoA synthase [Actinomadura rudentiformis]|uniref:Hydroxymethylglutaryl-CoA synthase n=1 Tax=Actinomadura rudentiformis TaxID=359158 RepID=A0A6H9Z1A8_9ACTN|nr:hydroxymethylglutaryl-CoA synthase [Actinomadura rudentiformis]KAB2346915.1 hydroxymethylglutaryl-CoA synthase [Actinomadura rudentiformis]